MNNIDKKITNIKHLIITKLKFKIFKYYNKKLNKKTI